MRRKKKRHFKTCLRLSKYPQQPTDDTIFPPFQGEVFKVTLNTSLWAASRAERRRRSIEYCTWSNIQCDFAKLTDIDTSRIGVRFVGFDRIQRDSCSISVQNRLSYLHLSMSVLCFVFENFPCASVTNKALRMRSTRSKSTRLYIPR